MGKGFVEKISFRPHPLADLGRLQQAGGANGWAAKRSTPMKRTVVRYKTKPEKAEENARLIEKVFQELRAKSPDGVRYLALKLADGSFIHFSTAEGDASPIPKLEAFQSFRKDIEERCIEPPQPSDVTIVGNYRMLGEE
jgi:hypothetical protein